MILDSKKWKIKFLEPIHFPFKPQAAEDRDLVRELAFDVREVMQKAIQAGGIEIHPTTDYDYGYRQGMFQDPFGHLWQIQKKI